MASVSHATIRRVARTTEWFIVDQIAKQIAPSERVFLLYEVRGPRSQHPVISRARRDHAVGRCIDEFVLVTVTREQLESVLDMPEWIAQQINDGRPIEANEARCVALTETSPSPFLFKLAARSVNRPSTNPALIDR